MCPRITLALLVLHLLLPCGLVGQIPGSSPVATLRPSAASAGLVPAAALSIADVLRGPFAIPTPQTDDPGGGGGFFLEAITLGAASLGGLWVGAQLPFPPADDDSDLSVWHLATAPAASIVAVSAASLLFGHDLPPSVRASLLGSAAGAAAGLLGSMTLDTGHAAVTYAGVHGLVAALVLR